MNNSNEFPYSSISADITWMMQSERVSDHDLIVVLVNHFGYRLAKLASRITKTQQESPESQKLVVVTLAQAVKNRQHYWADERLFKWLARLMVRQWKKPDKALVVSRDLDLASHADLIVRVETILKKNVSTGRYRRTILKSAVGLVIVFFLVGILINFRKYEFTPSHMPAATAAHSRGLGNEDKYRPGFFTYKYMVQPGDTLSSISEKTGVSLETMRMGWSSLDDSTTELLPSGWNITIPSSDGFRRSLVATPLAHRENLPLLTKNSTLEELHDRMNSQDTWSTLKVKYYIAEQARIPGYAGPLPPMMEIILLSRKPDLHTLITSDSFQRDGGIYFSYRSNGINYSLDPMSGEIQADFWEDSIIPLFIENGFLNFFGDIINETIVGEDTIAGRPAVIVDIQVEGNSSMRLWVDAETGYVLYWEMFSYGMETSGLGIMVVSIEYNSDIPSYWFDPGHGMPQLTRQQISEEFEFSPLSLDLAERVGYVHLEPNPNTPPSGLSVRTAPLTLQWVGDWDSNLVAGTNTSTGSFPSVSTVEVFLSDYLIGTIDVEISGLSSCLRSSDGKHVAMLGFSAMQGENYYEDYLGKMYILNLEDLELVEDIQHITNQGTYAFSPDSTRMVWTGCSEELGCGLHIYEIVYDMWTEISDNNNNEYIYRVGWSKDNHAFAYVSQPYGFESDPPCQIFAVDIVTGEKVLVEDMVDCSQPAQELGSLGYLVGKDPASEGCVTP